MRVPEVNYIGTSLVLVCAMFLHVSIAMSDRILKAQPLNFSSCLCLAGK